MDVEKPRLARLTAILTQLQSQKLVTAQSLAERHDVSIRTIYRDIKTLSQSGIPIITEEGRGYSIMEGYFLAPVSFTEHEANALITAAQIINRNKDQSLIDSYNSAIDKLKTVLRINQKDKVEVLENRLQIRNNKFNEKSSNYLVHLQSAITNYKQVKLKYKNVQGFESDRTIEPFALFSTHENWVLVANCHRSKDFRAFRLDRIQDLTILSEHFEPHNITLHEYFEQCKKNWSKTPDIGLTLASDKFAAESKILVMQTTQIESFTVVGMSFRMKNDADASTKFSAAWQSFMTSGLKAQIPNKVDDVIYALYTNYESDHLGPYDMILGYKVQGNADLPLGSVAHTVPSNSYSIFTAQGDMTQGALYEAWLKVWQSDVPRLYQTDFELHDERTMNPKNGIVDIYVSVAS